MKAPRTQPTVGNKAVNASVMESFTFTKLSPVGKGWDSGDDAAAAAVKLSSFLSQPEWKPGSERKMERKTHTFKRMEETRENQHKNVGNENRTGRSAQTGIWKDLKKAECTNEQQTRLEGSGEWKYR